MRILSLIILMIPFNTQTCDFKNVYVTLGDYFNLLSDAKDHLKIGFISETKCTNPGIFV